MNDEQRRTWWERIPPLFLIVLGMVIVGAKITTTTFDTEALMTMAGVLIGAGIVLEAFHHR